MISKSNIELLAPAGSFETLHAAINAGCDSVYLGVGNFNMRSSGAVNFTLDDLSEVVRIAHSKKVRVYVTINTVLYDEELSDMRRIVDEVKSVHADAVIAADMATILYARSCGIEVHISTQLSVSNIETVKFYSQFSDRIVLARELSLEQVGNICKQIKLQNITGPSEKLLKIEVFTHGALCVAVSGRCSMSLYCYGRSASRGQCAQICRRKYKVVDLETGQELVVDNNYVMSAADLSTIGMLKELVESGVSVLKIEGRGRGPEYVDTVIRTYKKGLSLIFQNKYSQKEAKKLQKELEKVFNRGFSKGLYMGRTFDEWAGYSGNKSKKVKILAGKVVRYFPKIKVAHIKILADLEVKKNDEFCITGPTTGIVSGKIKKMIINEEPVETASQGDDFTFVISKKVRKNDDFFIIKDRK